MLVKLLSRVKGRDIAISGSVPTSYLLGLAWSKALDLLRGLLRTRRLMFLGRGTRIKAAKQLYTQRGVEIGPYCHIDCLSQEGLSIGRSSKIGAYSIINVSGTLSDPGKCIRIGNNVGIGDYAHIGGAGGVSIGDDTITGAYLSIHPENHNFADLDTPIRLQGVNRKGIQIGANCWLGAKVTVLDGSVIGAGCIVAAGAVVSGVFEDNLIIGGVPAKVIGKRAAE